MRASIIGGAAGTKTRVLSGIVDLSILLAAGAFIATTNGVDPENRVPFSIRFGTKVLQDGPMFTWLLLSFAYFVISEWLTGASIGKLALGLRVRMIDGRRCTLSAALVRNLLRVVDAFPFVIPNVVAVVAVAGSSRHQRLGDMVAQTIVVRTH
jgi:uncharacterized RDD family membrane protein YckC